MQTLNADLYHQVILDELEADEDEEEELMMAAVAAGTMMYGTEETNVSN